MNNMIAFTHFILLFRIDTGKYSVYISVIPVVTTLKEMFRTQIDKKRWDFDKSRVKVPFTKYCGCLLK